MGAEQLFDADGTGGRAPPPWLAHGIGARLGGAWGGTRGGAGWDGFGGHGLTVGLAIGLGPGADGGGQGLGPGVGFTIE
jgi:hypothetical protein